MTLNPKAKPYMKNQKEQLVNEIKQSFPSIPFFEDEIAEDEEKKLVKGKYSAFVLLMGDLSPNENEGYLSQEVVLDYYSENRDDVDEMILDIVATIKNVKTFKFANASKVRARVKDSQRFIDVVSIEFIRSIKYGC